MSPRPADHLPADNQAREHALDITASFCVQAPAGSGKTELLTQRLLKLLAHVQQPEEILAFTFTRKAAAEMRERLLQNLAAAVAFRLLSPAGREQMPLHKRHTLELASAVLAQDEQQGWQLLQNPQRLRLNTIDSFTGWLSAQLPLSANLGARAVISTDMQAVFAEAIRTTLGMLEDRNAAATALQQLLPHLQNNLQTAQTLLQALLLKRDQWLPLVKQLELEPAGARAVMEATLRDMVASQLAAAATLLAPFRAALLELTDFAAGNLGAQPAHPLHSFAALAALPPAIATAEAVAQWRTLTDFLLPGSLEGFRSPKGLQARHGFPGQKEAKGKEQQEQFKAMKVAFGALCGQLEAAGCLPVLQMLARMPTPAYSEYQWEVLDALCTLLPVLAAQLNVAMQRKGTVDHTETSLAALRALGEDDEPTDLALRLDYRIRHILVDEFQDTSSMQFHLLEKLTAGWQQGDGRTLFIVGDGMQSCYAFRNAKVSLFLKARNEGIGSVRLQPLDLAVNFRSDSSVVNWVNAVFSQAFPRIDDLPRGGVRYSHSTARSATALTPGVHCRLWLQNDETPFPAATLREHEAREIALLCRQLQEANPQHSIAVLVRSRSHLRELVPALRTLGLRWNASKIDRLLSYPDIGDLFTLLRALLSLADRTAWLALLRTPFIGLPLADIHRLASHAQLHEQSLWSTLRQHAEVPGLSADANTRLQRVLPHLEQARSRRQHQPLRQVLEALWIGLGGPACLASAALLPNVAAFLGLVEQHARNDDITDIHALEEALDSTYGSAGDPAVNLELMTIHNAKGLEFDHVILPGLERKPRSNSKELLLWHEHLDSANRSRPLLGLLPEKGQPDDPLYDYLRFEHELRDALEATRLLYIAVTRAIRSAWLFGTVTADTEGLYAPSTSLLHQILPALHGDPETLQVSIETPEAAVTAPADTAPERLETQALRRLPTAWQPPPLTALWPPPGAPVADEPLHQNLLARTCGELVHMGLKLVVERGPAWLDGMAAPPAWRKALAPLCADAAMLDASLAAVRAQLRQCVSDSNLAWLFNGRQQQDACELALVDFSGHSREGYRRDFVIDRTFIDQDGCRWIIDYKSGAPGVEQPLAVFLQEQSSRYRQQLLDYASLFRHQPQPLKLALLFTAIPLLHVLA